MFQRMLVANDGSIGGRRALEAAIALAKQCNTPLHHIVVRESLPQYISALDLKGVLVLPKILDTEEEAESYFEGVTREAHQQANAAGIELISHTVHGHAGVEITKTVQEGAFELLIIGNTGHSAMFGHKMGDTCQELTKMTSCNVLVVKAVIAAISKVFESSPALP